jgi:predicted Zn finger-like uncharacterized protein
MVVTCASCLTKFHLDDSRLPARGAKVRCSRCRHVFYVTPASETRAEGVHEAESPVRQTEVQPEPTPERPAPASSPPEEEKWEPSEEKEEETFFFSERPGPAEEERKEKGAAARARTLDSRRRARRKRGPLLMLALIAVVVILILGGLYLFSELGPSGKTAQSAGSPLKKISALWNALWGKEREGLIVGGLSGYEEKIGEATLFVIDGKVYNQSSAARKHIKVKVTIFDQNKSKIAEKEAFCGNIISPAELKKLPPSFLQGDMEIRPQTAEDRAVPPGKGAAFIVLFKDASGQAKEFKVEIVEAPASQ